MDNIENVLEEVKSLMRVRIDEDNLNKLMSLTFSDEKKGRIDFAMKVEGQDAILLRVEAILLEDGKVMFIIQWLEEQRMRLHLCGKPESKLLEAVSGEAYRELKRLYKLVINNI